MGIDADNAVKKTREYIDSFLVEERLLDSVVADQTFELYGKTFSTPIMTPAFSHLKTFVKERQNGMAEYSQAAKNVNAVNWVGMCENKDFSEIIKTHADTIRIIKPYEDKDKIFSQIEFSEKSGALAVGIDIDHIFGTDGKCDVVMGEKMACQTTDDIRQYVAATKLPFVIKGVLSVQDAVKCKEAGVKGIVVSHHHGRFPLAAPPLAILPDIVKAVRAKDMKIFVDCGIDNGYDSFLALALGADAVSLGRVLMPELAKAGCEGVEKTLRKAMEQLAYCMEFSGCKDLGMINASLLYQAQGAKIVPYL